MIVKGWKVVRRTQNNRLTSSTLVESDEARVTYKPNEPAVPREGCGPLCVFSELADAEGYFKGKSLMAIEITMEVWECEYEPSPLRVVWVQDHHVATCKTPVERLRSKIYGCGLRSVQLASSITLKRREHYEPKNRQ
jgi:hypothetical protein